jgi:two-component system, response regulator PdtaR
MVAHRTDPYELLIADDDPGFRETVRSVFEPHARLVEASCGEEAIEIVRQGSIDLVLLDIHMPRLSGIETLRVVKSMRESLPCIVLSAGLTEQLQQEAHVAQAQAVLKKPVTLRQLIGSVCQALELAYGDHDVIRWLPG